MPSQPWALVAVAAVTAAILTRGPAHAALLAVAAGVVFGLAAALTLSLTRLLRHDSHALVLAHWQLWALLGLGTVGLLLSASAFQAGALSASLPVMDSVEPLSAVLIGTLVFGERLAASPGGLALQLAGAATAFAGILLLGRSPLAARAYSHAAGEHRLSVHGPGGRPPKPSHPTPEPPAPQPHIRPQPRSSRIAARRGGVKT